MNEWYSVNMKLFSSPQIWMPYIQIPNRFLHNRTLLYITIENVFSRVNTISFTQYTVHIFFFFTWIFHLNFTSK